MNWLPGLVSRLSLATALFIASLAGALAEPVRLPDAMPLPMAFQPFVSGSKSAQEQTLSELAPFPWIHISSPSGGDQVALLRQRLPRKIITIQSAYGGIPERMFSQVWPGHLLFEPGAVLTQDIGPNDSVVVVDRQDRIARSQKKVDKLNEKFPFGLIIYEIDEAGRPNWDKAEHLVLTEVPESVGKGKGRKAGANGKRSRKGNAQQDDDTGSSGQLIVKRAQWGSKALSFKAGRAVVAPHMMFWTRQWQLNLSAHCPRGGPGNLVAGEWYARVLAQRVKDENADGIELDVGRWTWGRPASAPMDIDNNRVADYGYIDGVNSFGLGGQILFGELRRLLGPDKLLQVDSNDAIIGYRGWRFVNGVQMESFPAANDFDRFSEAFTHLRLWTENAEALPRVSYPFSKTTTTVFANAHEPNGAKSDFHFRVGLAVAVMLGMPHPFSSIDSVDYDPSNDVNEDAKRGLRFGVYNWDEYHGGNLDDWAWLGRPLGPARQDLAATQGADLFAGVAWAWQVAGGFDAKTADGAEFTAKVTHIPADTLPPQTWFGVHLDPKGRAPRLTPGQEYTIVFDARGDDKWRAAGQSFERVPRMVAIRGPLKARTERPISLLVDATWRTYRISFIADGDGSKPLSFGVSEQTGDVALRNIRLYAGGVERWSREFEKGVVFMNMTSQPWTTALPQGCCRRLRGGQAPEVNNGEETSRQLTVPSRDAVFLLRTARRDTQ